MRLPFYLILLITGFILLRLVYVVRGYRRYKRSGQFRYFRNELLYTALYLCLLFGFIFWAQANNVSF
ncbi:hypothetical protein SAMN05444377_11537 [Flavobacterium fontis]|jgi:hypothetical protein|uniref:Uncharacterized protein n=1 Tax=Flavobacterium fontis TaxID=1124188 RepID=A0A1M5DIE1_9FLAO|nr:hypothetical protein [Flavobacterium fontis]SHF66788.1 hypothetical protein SAMN05444377_11537 [Flavobacterium fontis]